MEQHALPYFREALLFLALAGILIPLLQRMRVSQVLGFLAVGALVGPYGIGLWAGRIPWLSCFTFTRAEGVAALAELGMLFLMFTIGLELSPARLWTLRYWVFGAGIAQVCFSTAIIGSLAYQFGNPLESALILGFVLSLSSTAVVMQLMAERHSVGSPLGQAGFSILMLQDLAVVPLFILIGVLAKGEREKLMPVVALALVKSLGAVLLIYFWGRRLIRPLFLFFARHHQPDLFMALILLSTLGIAGLTSAAGLSMALGAFLAGLVLAETEFRYEVEVMIEPFKGLLMGLFFMTVGMQIDAREVAREPLWIPLSVAGLFAIKAAVLSVIFRIGGFDWGHAVEGSLLLGQGGEFAFIIVGLTISVGLLDSTIGQFMMLVVGISLFATPLAAQAGRMFRLWWERRHPGQAPPLTEPAAEPADGRVVIAGFGRVGQLLAQILAEQGIRFVGIEINAGLVAQLHSRGMPVFFGNAARTEILSKVDAEHAAAIVVTMDQAGTAQHIVGAVRREYPHVPLFARARDERHAVELKQAGATLAVPETLESGLQLCAFILQTVGIPEETVERVVETERERRISILQGGAEHKDSTRQPDETVRLSR
ncbi:MAG: potassium transporter [Herminiimonas sp.]|nr:potassium transporter [Herminiimonas sp.]